MADNKHQVSVVIGAALSSGFKEAISTSQTDFFKLGGIIKELDSSTLGVANKFQDLQRKTLEAKRAWVESEGEVKRLAVALKNTENPSAAMVREFEKSKNAAAKAKDAYVGKRASVTLDPFIFAETASKLQAHLAYTEVWSKAVNACAARTYGELNKTSVTLDPFDFASDG
ncbi:hypothetical protein FACS1894126_2580 [Alphaproteobacteria bacterium]|nr:hypothetical protein FACS1894126_2580 [Alphaproteobacteria bacterium]